MKSKRRIPLLAALAAIGLSLSACCGACDYYGPRHHQAPSPPPPPPGG